MAERALVGWRDVAGTAVCCPKHCCFPGTRAVANVVEIQCVADFVQGNDSQIVQFIRIDSDRPIVVVLV